MENLNNVPNQGTFGGAVSKINSNFGLVKEAIDGLENRTTRSKGLFPTAAALSAAIPSPKVGDYAYVGDSLPATVYDCLVEGTWHNTNQTGGSENVPLNNYPTRSEMNAAIAAIEIETVDNLNEQTAASGKALDAHQGFVLAGQIEDVQDAVDEIAEATDVSVSGTSAFEQGKIEDNGTDSTSSPTYYIRTPASSPIPILNGQTMSLKFIYKNSGGTVLSPDNTRIYKYLDGVYVGRVQTTAKTATVECDGTFNQLRIRAYKNGIGSSYSYCSVTYSVEKTLRGVAEQVDTNTANIESITSNLQDISETVGNMEGQTINKRVYTSADLGSSYYDLENPYQTTGSYSIYGGIKVPVKRGDHIVLYTIGSSGAARCWGLVDKYRKILRRTSTTNFLTTPAEIDVTEDCYLCANVATTKAAEKAQFNLTITSDLKAQVDGAVADLSALIQRAPSFCNNPFPFKGNVLRVLSLGNSFAEDTSQFIEGMMGAAGLDKSKFCYYFTFKSGATLAQYASNYVSGESYSCIDKTGSYSTTPRAGTYSMPNSSGSLKRIVSQDWDLILLQQASTDAYDWTTYQPYLSRLISYIKRDCPKACIGFMLTWATTYTGTTHAPSYSQRLEMNMNCAKKVLHEVGIDFIVPVGTAIQNARNTSLEDSDHLLRDNRHLNTGVGRYVAGCAFFDAVLAPFYGVSVVGNSLTTNSGTPVTDDNRELCQMCGHAAVANMWEVTTGLEPDVPEETTQET